MLHRPLLQVSFCNWHPHFGVADCVSCAESSSIKYSDIDL
jgi:hypothetical protein